MQRPLFFLCALWLLLCVGALASAPSHSDYSRPDLRGKPQRIGDLKGKIVVVNFWATWCVPCVKEMPLLQKLQKRHGDRLTVVAVSIDEPAARPKVEKFVAKHKLTFPILMDGKPEDLARFGLGEALPATAFLNERGEIEGRVLGQLHGKRLERRIAWMLGHRKGDPPPALEDNLKAQESAAPLPIR